MYRITDNNGFVQWKVSTLKKARETIKRQLAFEPGYWAIEKADCGDWWFVESTRTMKFN